MPEAWDWYKSELEHSKHKLIKFNVYNVHMYIFDYVQQYIQTNWRIQTASSGEELFFLHESFELKKGWLKWRKVGGHWDRLPQYERVSHIGWK